jgi:translation initiation factor 3 subunit B
LTHFSTDLLGKYIAIITNEIIKENPNQQYESNYILTNPNRFKLKIYQILEDSLDLFFKIENLEYDNLKWSPRTPYFILYTVNNQNAYNSFQIWDLLQKNLIVTNKYFGMTDIEWDPTGRFVTSSVSQFRRSNENGFIIWNLTGAIIREFKTDKFWSFF